MKKLIILFLLASFLSLSCSTRRKPGLIIYLIPEGYTGEVLILYNQPDGITLETDKDGASLYRIPKNGFLKVKPEYENIGYNYRFYYINEKGDLRPIDYIYPQGEFEPTEPRPKTWSSLTEDETNNGIFAMDYRSIGNGQKGDKNKLFVFSLGHPKDAKSLYINTGRRSAQIRKEIYLDDVRP